ncbi:hypothetical protein COHA_000095 [Chlorella ohadii]|uniref:Uncharacterized protein n=1 Tax=Chlorella ohadii TaxID=2649997 RepID=A0AAD5E1J4_9CHLO|nr:hypothetical protein COHA_000095 [Chlorella ohadii]
MAVGEVVDEVLGEALERQGKQLEAMTAELERRGKQLGRHGNQLEAMTAELQHQGKLLAALERDTEADAKSLGRAAYTVHDSDRYWPAAVMMDAEDLVAVVSCEGFPADLEEVLSEVLAGHCGYLSLRDLLLLRLAGEVSSVRSLAAQFGQCGGPGWWQEERLRLEEVAALLQQQPGAPLPWDQQLEGEDEDGPWWAPFLSTLLAYSEEAGKEGGDQPGGSGGLRRFLQMAQPQPDGRAPVVMMVVALAAGQLRAHLRFGGGPRLAAQGSVLSVRVMEIKHVLKGPVCMHVSCL